MQPRRLGEIMTDHGYKPGAAAPPGRSDHRVTRRAPPQETPGDAGGTTAGEKEPEWAPEGPEESGAPAGFDQVADLIREIGTDLFGHMQDLKKMVSDLAATAAAIHKGATLIFQKLNQAPPATRPAAPPAGQGAGGRPSGGGAPGGGGNRPQGQGRPQGRGGYQGGGNRGGGQRSGYGGQGGGGGRQGGGGGPYQGELPQIAPDAFGPGVLEQVIDGGKWQGTKWGDLLYESEGPNYMDFIVRQACEKAGTDPYRWKYDSPRIALWCLQHGQAQDPVNQPADENTQPLTGDGDVPF